jgi:hypothetical protein
MVKGQSDKKGSKSARNGHLILEILAKLNKSAWGFIS